LAKCSRVNRESTEAEGQLLLINVELLKNKFGILPTGILHVGAHLAEELDDYEDAGWSELNKIIWVESQFELAQKLIHNLDPKRNKVINATVWSETGKKMNFHVANNSQSSSLYELGTHATTYPDIKFNSERTITTVRLDEIIDDSEDISFVNLDIQGAELEALKGLGSKIHKVKWIYSEVNKKSVYEGCAKIGEIDKYLEKFLFTRVATRWVYKAGWGDALWIKKSERRRMATVIFIFKITEVLRLVKLFSYQIKHEVKARLQLGSKPK
jgi:FkbM family methyltransferase